MSYLNRLCLNSAQQACVGMDRRKQQHKVETLLTPSLALVFVRTRLALLRYRVCSLPARSCTLTRARPLNARTHRNAHTPCALVHPRPTHASARIHVHERSSANTRAIARTHGFARLRAVARTRAATRARAVARTQLRARVQSRAHAQPHAGAQLCARVQPQEGAPPRVRAR